MRCAMLHNIAENMHKKDAEDDVKAISGGHKRGCSS